MARQPNVKEQSMVTNVYPLSKSIDNYERVALSLSGGLDSVTLMAYLASHVGAMNVFPISFVYGQRHSLELECARYQVQDCNIPLDNYSVIDISFLGDITSKVSAMVEGEVDVPSIQQALGDPQPASYVPFRNLIFSSLVAAYAESNNAKAIALGIQAVDQLGYWDTTSTFAEALQNIFNLNRKNQIKVLTPFVNAGKEDEIKLGLSLGVNYKKTWTCYNGAHDASGNKIKGFEETRDWEEFPPYACGICASCHDRKRAFAQLGKEDEDVKYLDPEVATSVYSIY